MQLRTESDFLPASLLKSLPRPFKLTLALTYQCNSRCEMCRIWERTEQADDLTPEEIGLFFEKNSQFLWIDITGGEIFLRSDLLDIAARIAEKCPGLQVLHFPTNGLLTDEIVSAAREMRRMGFPHLVVTVSLDGTRGLNDKLRGIEGSWERSLETFSRLREIEGIETYIGMTLSHGNKGDIFPAIRQAQEELALGDDDLFHLNLAHFSGHYFHNLDLRETYGPEALSVVDQFLASRDRDRSFGARMEGIYLDFLKQYMETGQRPLPCRALESSCFVDPSGRAFPCIIYGEPLGSLRDVSFDLKVLWDTDRRRELRQQIQRGDCPHCWTPCEAYISILESERHLGSLLETVDLEEVLTERFDPLPVPNS